MKSVLQLLLSTLILLITSCSKNENHDSDISYHVAYKSDSNNLNVDFKYKSDTNGDLILKFENSSWGDNDIYNCIDQFEVKPKPISVEFDREQSLVKIKTAPNQENTIQYSIKQDFTEDLKNHHRYRPIITNSYFHILGMRLFMFPTTIFETEESKAKISISWGELPNNWLFHSSFGPEKNMQIEVIQEDLYATFFVGGDFRRYQFNYKDKPVYFVTRGDWKAIKDEQVLSILKETVNAQYKFWNDSIKNSYSVSLIPTFEEWTATSKSYSFGGSCLTNSFISFVSNNDGATLKKVSWLYNHELLHQWIGRTLKNENEVEQYWFSEGFTDYYSYKLMLKHNKLTVQEFIDILNTEVVIPHYQDKYNTMPNSEITFQKYWSNYGALGKLPYRRGLLYAFLIDMQIKQQSNFTKSLDNIMHSLNNKSKKDIGFRISSTTFKSELALHVDSNTANQFETYITNGKLIDFKGKLLKGLTIEETNNMPLFGIDKALPETLLNQLQL